MRDLTTPGDVTKLLLDWRNGDQDALNRLMPLVYDELRRIAIGKFQQYGSDPHSSEYTQMCRLIELQKSGCICKRFYRKAERQ
jgi:hypothetical protein